MRTTHGEGRTQAAPCQEKPCFGYVPAISATVGDGWTLIEILPGQLGCPLYYILYIKLKLKLKLHLSLPSQVRKSRFSPPIHNSPSSLIPNPL